MRKTITITITLSIDTDEYDVEFGEDPEDIGPNDFIDLAQEMVSGGADFPEEGCTITCDGVSRQFKQ